MENYQDQQQLINTLFDLTTGIAGLVEALMAWVLVSDERALPYLRERLDLRLNESARIRDTPPPSGIRVLDDMTLALFHSFLSELHEVQMILDAGLTRTDAVRHTYRYRGFGRSFYPAQEPE